MNKCDLRKQLLRYNEELRTIKSVKSMTSKERDNQTKEIRALQEKIRKMKEELYEERVDKR